MLKSISIPHNKITLSLHALAWFIVIIIPLYLNNSFGGGNLHRLYEFYLHTFSAAVIFYLGYLWLVPKYFLQDKKFTYVIIIIGLILATHYITNFIEESYL